jgi:uncharacterized OsmC-like protein
LNFPERAPSRIFLVRSLTSLVIERIIILEGDLNAEQRAQLMEIADKCPVHHTLKSEIDIRTVEELAAA